MSEAENTADGMSPIKRALLEVRLLRARLAELEQGRAGGEEASEAEPVAVVGLGCRLPGGVDSPEAFWELLHEGREALGEVPPGRWPAAWFDPDPHAPGRMSTRRGGFLEQIDRFDAAFFGISPREAASLDPQQRLLLEVAWETFEHAAMAPDRLKGSHTGVFIGISGFDYLGLELQGLPPKEIDVYLATGATHSVAAGRLSYFLGLQGPSLALDTACSSSLMAVHLACQSLRAGECELALAGGVNVLLMPEMSVTFSKAGMMAADGRCKFGAAGADGFVRAEGCVLLALKPLARARRDGDCIFALLRASAANQDGRSAGLTAPNGPAQQALLRAALERSGLAPHDVGYVEAHGTGTALGDPIELGALGATLGAGRPRGAELVVGSLKTNLGHLEAAAGAAGLLKLILALERGVIPPSLHGAAHPSPLVDWAGLGLRLAAAAEPWPLPGRRRGGVSAFGFAGTNVHVVAEQGDEQAEPAAESGPELLVLSARSGAALGELARRWGGRLEQAGGPGLAAACRTGALGRAHFAHRLALVAETADEAARKLKAFAAEEAAEGMWAGCGPDRESPLRVSFSREPDGVTSAEEGTHVMTLPGEGAAAEEWRPVLEQLGRFYAEGAAIDWTGFHGVRPGPRAQMPTYPFEREPYWLDHDTRARRPEAARLWQAAAEAARRQARQAPLELRLEAYPARWRSLDRLALAWIVAALRHFGLFTRAGESWSIDGAQSQAGIPPAYRALLARWLEALAKQGVLAREGENYLAATPLPEPALADCLEEARAAWAGEPILMEYLERCGTMLPAIVSGRENALETIFPGGATHTAEWLYRDWPVARYFNEIVRAAVEGFVRALPAGSPLRMLEIGGGTGGTTASLISTVTAGDVEYHFTDVSAAFFSRVETLLGGTSGVRFGVLDIERNPAEQGYAPQTFDLVLAANVLHATRDLEQAVRHASGLLAPGGLLLLYETTQHPVWFDISIGLLEGWGRFDDPWRQNNPLLSRERWEEILRWSGLEPVEAFPAPGSPAGVLPNHVLLAQATREVAPVPPAASAAPPQAKRTATAATSEAEGHGLRQRLRAAATPEEAHEMLVDYVRSHVIRILRRDPVRGLDRRARLMEIGVDSLMAVELRTRLGKGLGLDRPLPATLIFDWPTVEAVAGYLEREVLRLALARTHDAPCGGESVTQTPPMATDATRLAQMTEEEAEWLMQARLAALERE